MVVDTPSAAAEHKSEDAPRHWSRAMTGIADGGRHVASRLTRSGGRRRNRIVGVTQPALFRCGKHLAEADAGGGVRGGGLARVAAEDAPEDRALGTSAPPGRDGAGRTGDEMPETADGTSTPDPGTHDESTAPEPPPSLATPDASATPEPPTDTATASPTATPTPPAAAQATPTATPTP